jgi:predicted deacylase
MTLVAIPTTRSTDPEDRMETLTLQGERMLVLEKVIVSPRSGVFRSVRAGGGDVDRGETIGHVHGTGTAVAVTSAFCGELMGMLAHEGERVREGQPIAWLRTA